MSAGDKLDGRTAFTLYDTYGFPLDLTQDALRAKGIEVDTDGFDAAMAEQREMSKADGGKFAGGAGDDLFKSLREEHGATHFNGYDDLTSAQAVLSVVQNDESVKTASDGEIVFITNETPFYAESGGQAGDKGVATFENGARIEISDVQKRAGDLHAHIGILSGQISLGDIATLAVDAGNRERTKRNHSGAHLLHEALRRVLGDHVAQKGQMVDGERIRFDISHPSAISRDELARVEAEVNEVICLLYTSPSPRDRTRSRMPSSA